MVFLRASHACSPYCCCGEGGGAGGGIVSFFSHAASRDRLHVALYQDIMNYFKFLLNFHKIMLKFENIPNILNLY